MRQHMAATGAGGCGLEGGGEGALDVPFVQLSQVQVALQCLPDAIIVNTEIDHFLPFLLFPEQRVVQGHQNVSGSLNISD